MMGDNGDWGLGIGDWGIAYCVLRIACAAIQKVVFYWQKARRLSRVEAGSGAISPNATVTPAHKLASKRSKSNLWTTQHAIRITQYATLLFIFLLTACSNSADNWPAIESRGVLRVGLDPTYPPFESAENGPVAGIDVDLANALAAELGLSAEFVFVAYDGLYDSLTTERTDMLLSGLVIDESRSDLFTFSEPYFNAGQVLVARDGEESADIDSRSGQTIAVELGAEGHVVATTWARRVPDVSVQPFDTADAALDAVRNGSANVALTDSISARLNLAAHGALFIIDPAVTVEPFVAVMRADDAALHRRVEDALAQLEASGQLDAIIDRWLGP